MFLAIVDLKFDVLVNSWNEKVTIMANTLFLTSRSAFLDCKKSLLLKDP